MDPLALHLRPPSYFVTHAGVPIGIGLGCVHLNQPDDPATIVEKTGGGAGFTTYKAVSKPRTHSLIERWFFPGMALLMISTCSLAFLPSIGHPAGRQAPLSTLAAAHGIVFFAWLLLFLVQSILIATQHVAWHRRLGLASIVILALMIPLAYTTTIAMVRRGYDLSGDLAFQRDPTEGTIFPLANLLIFSILAIAALVYRSKPKIHKRLVLFANIELMPAPLAHLIGLTPLLAALPPGIVMVPISAFVAAAVARDLLVARRVHPLTGCLAILRIVSGPLEAGPIGTSGAWRQLVHWLAR
jgi:hypothetical protein